MLSLIHTLPLAYMIGLGLAAAASAYLVLAIVRLATSRFAPEPARDFHPPVTVLKPLCGNEPELYSCLRSFCDQDYPEYQVIFGVVDPADPAINVVRRLISEFPDRDLALVVDPAVHGTNLKIANLINMDRATKHGIVVISDSDTRVARDCLRRVVAPLAHPATGAVTCLYKAAPAKGFASQLGALFINDWFLSSAVVDARMREIAYCFGPVSAVRRDALDAIGGLPGLANHLADDFMLGRTIRAAGYQVALSSYVPDTVVAEDLRSLLSHELRWARTVRAVKPGEHFMSVVTEPLPLLLALLLPYPALGGWVVLGAVVTLRVMLHYLLRARFDIAPPPCPWLLPLRECLCFAIWMASFLGATVQWRQRDFTIGAGGRLIPAPSRSSGGGA